MLEFIVFILFFVILVPGVWVFSYRRGVGSGVGKLMSHIRGLVFSGVTLGVLFIVFAVIVGAHSSAPKPDAMATTKENTPTLRQADTPAYDASDESYARFARMYQNRHLEKLENELYERHVGALKIIPALGGNSNVADVLKSQGIRLGPNPDITCLPMVKLAKAPGCMLTVYLTRRKPDQQTNMSGVPAHWFMGVNETRFRPLDGWARHVDQNDQWLNADGAFGEADYR